MGDIPSSAYLCRKKRKKKIKPEHEFLTEVSASSAGPHTHCREGAVRGGCWVRAPLLVWGPALRGGAGQGRAYPGAALRGRRHQGEGVIQKRVHLLPGLFNGGLGGHVGWRSRGRVKDLVSGGGAAVVRGQVGVRL